MSMGMLPCRVVRGREEKERTLQEEGQDLIEYLNHDIRDHVIECQQFPICQSVCRWHKAEIITITEFSKLHPKYSGILKLSCVLLSYDMSRFYKVSTENVEFLFSFFFGVTDYTPVHSLARGSNCWIKTIKRTGCSLTSSLFIM